MNRELLSSITECPSHLVATLSEKEGVPGRRREALFYSGASVERFDWWTGEAYDLTFSMDGGDLSELLARGRVLDGHSRWSVTDVLGKVEYAERRKDGYVAGLLFSDREELNGFWQDVEAGILRDVSMGVTITKLEDVTPKNQKRKQVLATSWKPFEISVTPIGADPGARLLAADPRLERARRLMDEIDASATARLAEEERAKFRLAIAKRRHIAGM